MTDVETLLLMLSSPEPDDAPAPLDALVEIPDTSTILPDDWFTSGLDETDVDNSGATVILNDGVTMSYDDWIAAGQPNPDPDAGEVDVGVPADAFDATGWADHRRESISVVGMLHMSAE